MGPSLEPSSLASGGLLQGPCSEMLRRTDQINFRLHGKVALEVVDANQHQFLQRILSKPP